MKLYSSRPIFIPTGGPDLKNYILGAAKQAILKVLGSIRVGCQLSVWIGS